MKQKTNNNIKNFILSEFLCFLPLLIGIILYSKLPERIAIHFDNNNEPNNYATKAFVIFAVPLLIMLIQALVYWRYQMDDEKSKLGRKLSGVLIYSTPVIVNLAMAIVYMYALDYGINISLICMIMCGLFVFILGNYIPKCRYIGFRLPWASDEEAVWHRTYHFTGWIFVFDGILMIVFSVLNVSNSMYAILWLIFVIAPFLFLLIFSLIDLIKH